MENIHFFLEYGNKIQSFVIHLSHMIWITVVFYRTYIFINHVINNNHIHDLYLCIHII